MVSNEEFLALLAQHAPPDQRLLLTVVPGDPEAAAGTAWRARPWTRGATTPGLTTNNYVAVSAFRADETGVYARRAAQFGAGLALMIDDVGTKVPAAVLDRARPLTALVETSPGNFQAWYFLREPITEYDRFATLQRAFVERWAGARDPGMGGPNRVGRLPEGINGKRKYGGAWACRAVEWKPEAAWTVAELLAAFDLSLLPPASLDRFVPGRVTDAERAARGAEFEALVEALSRHRMFRRPAFGRNGRRPILCPWHEQHTDGAVSGTYLSLPSDKNGWWGSYVCYHSGTHNDKCHLRDLKAWVGEAEDARLERALAIANLNANDWSPAQ